MTRIGFATQQELLRWADTVGSRSVLPRLIRRLILETGSDVADIDFPAAEGTAAGGWDGVAQTGGGSTFVPACLSLWELSVNSKANEKAEDDYSKRLTTPDGSPTTDVAYCQVILRRWTGRAAFATAKAADNRWREVRAYGVDDVETWLEAAPVTHAWISEQLGLEPYGVQTAEAWWAAWASATTPALITDVVLAGRAEAAEELRGRLSAPPQITTLRADSRDEALAFVAAVAISDDQNNDGGMLARVALIDDVGTWRVLADHPQPLILVATTPDVIAEARSAPNHHVIVPLTTGSRADVTLPPVDARETVAALESLGLEDRKAEAAGRLARRSLLALRRHLANKPELHQPSWAQPPIDRRRRGLLLACRWSEADGDQNVLEDLTGTNRDDLRESLAALAADEDPMVGAVDHTWALTSEYDAWLLLQPELRADDLERFGAAVMEVLLEADPLAGLDEKERWRAPLEGKVRKYSSDLRHGLARSLALLGTHGGSIDYGGGATGSTWARVVVRDLLKAANDAADVAVWASFSELLPLLAEASPDAFIDAVRHGAQGAAPILRDLFQDAEDQGFLGPHSPHTGLLWALEAVAWSPEHFGAAVDLLARLEELDPGGRLSNRPFRCLVSIFCPWHPDNSVSWESRLGAIDGLRQRHPEVAWRLMLRLLPDFNGVHDPTYAPRFRDWKPETKPVLTVDYVAFVTEIAARLREDAGDDAERWCQLVEEGLHLGPDDRRAIRAGLAEFIERGQLAQSDGTKTWTTLRDLVARHREFSDADWALREEELVEFEAIGARIAPTDAGDAGAWLFAEHMPDLGTGETRRHDYQAYREALAGKRREAIAAIEDAGGFSSVKDIADGSAVPNAVGAALAEASDGRHDDAAFALLAEGSAAELDFASGYLWRRYSRDGWDFVTDLLARHNDAPASARAKVLLSTGDFPKAWEVAGLVGEDVVEAFWVFWPTHGLGTDSPHVVEAGDALLKVGRCAAALDLVAMHLHGSEEDPKYVAFVLTGLTALLTAPERDAEIARLSQHDFQQLFAYLERHRATAPPNSVARLEWAFLPALGLEPHVPTLHSALADDPGFFVEIMKVIYRGHSEEPSDDADPQREALATNGYRLLSSWREVPGRHDGVVDAAALGSWVREVLEALQAVDRVEVGELQVGHMLASAPPDPDGNWPSVAVRDLLETLQNDRVEEAFRIEMYNRRGITSRDPEDGGSQERALVEKYRADAGQVADRWPRTAVILRALADSYEQDARRYESEAERRRRGIG